jgi:hypothetical protein
MPFHEHLPGRLKNGGLRDSCHDPSGTMRMEGSETMFCWLWAGQFLISPIRRRDCNGCGKTPIRRHNRPTGFLDPHDEVPVAVMLDVDVRLDRR